MRTVQYDRLGKGHGAHLRRPYDFCYTDTIFQQVHVLFVGLVPDFQAHHINTGKGMCSHADRLDPVLAVQCLNLLSLFLCQQLDPLAIYLL